MWGSGYFARRYFAGRYFAPAGVDQAFLLNLRHKLINYRVPFSNFTAGGPPTVDNDASQNYAAGSIWVERGVTVWMCFDNTTGAAQWAKIAPAIDDAAWTGYTPTVTAGTGAFGAVSASGSYKQIGKVVNVQISINITTNGSAAGYVQVTLPVAALVASKAILFGREMNVLGFGLQGEVGTTYLFIYKLDNSYPGANGHILVLSGAYEAA